MRKKLKRHLRRKQKEFRSDERIEVSGGVSTNMRGSSADKNHTTARAFRSVPSRKKEKRHKKGMQN